MTINYATIKRALVSHNKAYRRALKGVQIVYYIEMGKSWGYLSYPTEPPGETCSRGVSWEPGSQDKSQDYIRSGAEDRRAVSETTAHSAGPVVIPCVISPLRTALEAAQEEASVEPEVVPPEGETHPQGEKLGARMGVFTVMGGGPRGGDTVRELSACFVQGKNLETVSRERDAGGARAKK